LANTDRKSFSHSMPLTEVISVKDPESTKKAAFVLKSGGVILYPTETLYGIGAFASMGDSVERIFEIKGRPHGKPIPVLVRDKEMLAEIAEITPLASILIDEYWPGALTLILKDKANLPELVTCGTGRIALRISAHTFLQGLFDLINDPLTSTSANLSGGENLRDSDHFFETFNGKVDLIVDSGNIPHSKGSTIVDLTLEPPQILREGDIDAQTLQEFIDGNS